MITPTKAKKFRIRRATPTPSIAAAEPASTALPDMPVAPDPQRPTHGTPVRAPMQRQHPTEAPMIVVPDTAEDDGFGPDRYPTAAPDTVLGPTERTPEEEIAAIRAEGLTGRQLRMARRVAQRHGIEVTSDFEAVRVLRRRGIDPFQRSNILDLVVSEAQESKIQLPQTTRQTPQLPAAQQLTPERRAAEILKVQRSIARRRRRKLALLMTRLAFFVMLPTLIAGWYYFAIATPLYATRSEFVIQQAESQAGGLGSLFSGTQFATSQDSITVQGYMQSREAMKRLDRDLGFRNHWSQPGIDPLQRLAPDATDEAAYRTYKRNVKIGYDPTEGIIKMEVIAADPEVSTAFAEALIGYAEEQVDHLTQRLRADQMQGARESYADAEAKVQAAQARVLEMQEKLGVLDPISENSVVMQQIGTFEVQLAQKRLELQQLNDNAQPNAARVSGVEGDIARLQNMIGSLRAQLTESTGGTASLAMISGQMRIAEAELQTRQLMLSQAAQQMEVARIEANKQVRYLSTGVRPLAPDEPTYPRAFENTLVAMLIFSGLYLMLSLTASILREQVSA
ncbi:capsule biosynthesis protein [Frigidibacter mobilis]|uniref:Capsule polysaccharide export inner-membrane protein KpsE n=1 Tax=Frigidibacter mobilis TaxID=1335048 RepID=A0A159Z1W3_9RHOB|nr:capsule biosynthesis protein [Frigidibacter mobilis]AMY67960.1 capsule polysaccharide export inner-membrane protein KpsE [Frigidibacter mobilis]